eukprot:Clim_evm79s153 gene=Clim_evmTU79s153
MRSEQVSSLGTTWPNGIVGYARNDNAEVPRMKNTNASVVPDSDDQMVQSGDSACESPVSEAQAPIKLPVYNLNEMDIGQSTARSSPSASSLEEESIIDTPVIETTHCARYIDSNGEKYVNQYRILGTISIGTHGTVKLCQDHTGQLYALKALVRPQRRRGSMLTRARRTDEDILMEIAIMKRLFHEHIVCLHEVIDDPEERKIYMILDFLSQGHICYEAEDGSPVLSEQEAKNYFVQLIHGLLYVHSQGVLHRDIKPENLVIDDHGFLKICDFSVSQIMDDNGYVPKTTVGTPAFYAPETCHYDEELKPLTAAVDVWAAGITLYCFLMGKTPFSAPTEAALYQAIQEQTIEYPRRISSTARDLLSAMLERDPEKRMTIEEIIDHPWCQGADYLEPVNYQAPGTILREESILSVPDDESGMSV